MKVNMNPKFHISNSKSFTVWETGCWYPNRKNGSAIIVAGPQGEKLQVIYDADPLRTPMPALFFAEVGQVLAGARVRQNGNMLTYHLDLLRIKSLVVKQVQGRPVPTAPDPDILYMSQKQTRVDTPIDKILEDVPDLPSLPNARELMYLAIEKAQTPLESQRVFYGIPRATEQAYSD